MSSLKAVIDFRLAEANGTPVSFVFSNASSPCCLESHHLGSISFQQTKVHDLALDIKEVLLGGKTGQGIIMSNNARKLYDRVLEGTSRPLEEIADTLQFSLINFVSSVTGKHFLLCCPRRRLSFTADLSVTVSSPSLCEID